MRSILFIALGSVAAFVAGLAGTYVLMPIVAPDFVAAERMVADSLAADSLAADSLEAAALVAETEAPTPASADSLAALQRRLAEYEAQIGALQTEIGTTKAQQAQARDLIATLIKLERDDLSAVLARLDFDVLALLYAEASARDRTRLLAALEPSRTAMFVRRLASQPGQGTAISS
ncbi:MAG: hypothetical protein AAGI91_06520 [Bacteroidota bacterium]